MHKFKFTILSCIATALIFAACSDDKNEPDNPDPNINNNNPTELPTVEKGKKYHLYYPVECTMLNYNKTIDGHTIWEYDGLRSKYDEEKSNGFTDFTPFGFLTGTWEGSDDHRILVKRTDGKKLEINRIGCQHSIDSLPPLYTDPFGTVVLFSKNYYNFWNTEKSDLQLKPGEKYDQGTYSIERIDDYSYIFTVKALQKDEKERTRYVYAYSHYDFEPCKITSLDGKTEYKITQEVLDLVPNVCIICPGFFSRGPLTDEELYDVEHRYDDYYAPARNPLLKGMNYISAKNHSGGTSLSLIKKNNR